MCYKESYLVGRNGKVEDVTSIRKTRGKSVGEEVLREGLGINHTKRHTGTRTKTGVTDRDGSLQEETGWYPGGPP